jgi:hypothetical protein
MFGAIPLVYRIAAGVAFLAAIFAAGVFTGYRHEHDALVSYRAQVAQEVADQTTASKAKDAEFERVKKESQDAYETQLGNNTAYWAKRLRNFSCASTLPQASSATGKVDAAPADALPDYAKLVMDCQATTVQLEALQDWVRKTR